MVNIMDTYLFNHEHLLLRSTHPKPHMTAPIHPISYIRPPVCPFIPLVSPSIHPSSHPHIHEPIHPSTHHHHPSLHPLTHPPFFPCSLAHPSLLLGGVQRT